VPLYEAQLDRDWRHVLVDSGAKVVVVATDAIAARVAALRVPCLEHTVVIDADASDPRAFAHLLREWSRVPAITPDPGSVAEIVYTSGTTGVPKGVLLTHANVVSNIDSVLQVVPLDHRTRTLSFLPWAHVFGGIELHGVIRLGSSMALCDAVDALPERLREVQPTCLFAVPRVWNKLYQAIQARMAKSSRTLRALFEAGRRASAKQRRGEPLGAAEKAELAVAQRLIFRRMAARLGGRLEYAVSAAATLDPRVAELIDDLGITVLEAYGMTECSACATINTPSARRLGSVGRPIPGVRIAIDESVGVPEGGEIVIYGHGVMVGYHRMPEETRTTIGRDGGLRSGDLGRVDEDGYLYITGRLKELYKLENGKYVAPASIEERLSLSPFIAQAFVYGADRPHNVALIVPDAAALQAWATREHLEEGADALVAHAEVRAMMAREIAKQSTELRAYEHIHAFALLQEPFSAENGLLTPTLKAKRRMIEERYRPTLAALYAALDQREGERESAHA
jgi:long-chain acyl-CoA synthetase